MTAAEQWLSADELVGPTALTQPDVHARHVIGRSITRLLAAANTGSDPRNVELAFSAEGKPLLPNSEGLNVNVAHAADVVAVAAASGVAVGVDVELPVAAALPPQRIANRLLTAGEAAHLMGFTGEAATRELVRYWVVKEAVGKALGTRLIRALSGVELEPDGDGLRLKEVKIGPPADEWTVHQTYVEGGNEMLAVALPARAVSVGPIRWVDPAALESGTLPGARG